jgi:hypothetical protein
MFGPRLDTNRQVSNDLVDDWLREQRKRFTCAPYFSAGPVSDGGLAVGETAG